MGTLVISISLVFTILRGPIFVWILYIYILISNSEYSNGYPGNINTTSIYNIKEAYFFVGYYLYLHLDVSEFCKIYIQGRSYLNIQWVFTPIRYLVVIKSRLGAKLQITLFFPALFVSKYISLFWKCVRTIFKFYNCNTGYPVTSLKDKNLEICLLINE